MAKILGLDLGTNSVGWAVVEKEKGEDFKLLEKGVRIFQEGVKKEKGVEGAKAAERTAFRSARRLKYRRKLRKIELLKVLSAYNLCPKLTKEELADWRYKKVYPKNKAFLDWQSTDEATNKNPYHYRALSVECKLELTIEYERFKLGRALFHLVQRRGFLSNRLESTRESDGAVKKSIAEISEAKGEQTLGQYFYEKYQKGERIRNIYTHRNDHYLDEFERICECQQLSTELVDKLRKAIFYQRPLKSQKGLIGKCVFEPRKSRCAVSRPEFEEYRMLCFVNNIKIKPSGEDKLRKLTPDERDKILPRFYLQREYFDFEDLAKQLAPKKQYKYYKARDIYTEDWLFNYNMKTTVSGCPVSARLKDWFGDDFMNIQFEYIRETDRKESVIDINDIWHVLYSFDSDEKLAEFARTRLHFTEDKVGEFLKIRLKQDYASLSLKAIRKILPYLRKGLIYSHAVFLANMEEVIPPDIWSDKSNRDYIREEIKQLIDTQNEEKQITDIVNGFIKTSRNDENQFVWSEKAIDLFKKDLKKKIESYYGINSYSNFTEEKKKRIETGAFELLKKQMQKNMGRGEFAKVQRIDDRVIRFISDNFDVEEELLSKIYHPSAIDVYKPPVKGTDGRYYLGSPKVASIRNPMAMRAMHQLRKVINELIREDIIDSSTKVNVEMSRGLLNANERKATQDWQRDNETRRKSYASKIKEFLKGGTPSEEEILKYQLWEEQKHKCLYTGKEIRICDFLGAIPKFDIEHTIPRSLSFDNSQVNKTLCENTFNRSKKKNKIPFQLPNHFEILERIEPWKEKYEELDKQINIAVRQAKLAQEKEAKDRAIQKRHKLSYERDYWRNKYQRFTMPDIPEGFKNSQLVDTGIITKYSRMYLKTYFDKVYTVKGNTVASFRKLWGIQSEYEKKERVNHLHHCIDAITIACITKEQYENLAKFYHEWEGWRIKGVDKLPPVDKPWLKFTEDVKTIEKEVLVSHYSPDVLPKQSRKKLRKRGKIQYDKNGKPIYLKGDTIRGSLHKDTFYGAVKCRLENKQGETEEKIRYVVRKPLDMLEDSNLKNIVDERVREIVIAARKEEKQYKKEIDALNQKLQKADEYEEEQLKIEIKKIEKKIKQLYCLPNKNGTPVPIKKVRLFQPTVTNPLHIKKQRDKSIKKSKPWKEEYYAANDCNYLMAIYEGKDKKGKLKRAFQLKNNFESARYFKASVQSFLKPLNKQYEGLIDDFIIKGKVRLDLKYVLKTGTLVLFYNSDIKEILDQEQSVLVKRLYKVVSFEADGRVVVRHQLTAKPDKELKRASAINWIDVEEKLRLSISQFNAIVEGVDFKLTTLGKIIMIKR